MFAELGKKKQFGFCLFLQNCQTGNLNDYTKRCSIIHDSIQFWELPLLKLITQNHIKR